MIDWIKNEAEELKDWVVSGTIVDVKVWWVIAAWVLWKYVLGQSYELNKKYMELCYMQL